MTSLFRIQGAEYIDYVPATPRLDLQVTGIPDYSIESSIPQNGQRKRAPNNPMFDVSK